MEGRARTYNWTPYHSNTEKADRERSIHKASSDRYGVNVRRSVKAQYACRQARQSSESGSKLIFLIAVSAMLLFAGIVFFSGMTPSGMSVVEANQQLGGSTSLFQKLKIKDRWGSHRSFEGSINN